MAENTLIGRNYTPLDLVAKVTGRARYAEDFRAAGMLFCKLLLSPMPHARVKSVEGAGYGAVLNAIADAVGVDVFRRAPVTADIVLMSLEHGKPMHEPLRAHL
jgi:CO/xanthine dehydrogenase Mo-binding subunit